MLKGRGLGEEFVSSPENDFLVTIGLSSSPRGYRQYLTKEWSIKAAPALSVFKRVFVHGFLVHQTEIEGVPLSLLVVLDSPQSSLLRGIFEIHASFLNPRTCT